MIRKTYDSVKSSWRVDVVEEIVEGASLSYTFPLTQQDADWLVAALTRRRATLVTPRSIKSHQDNGTMDRLVGRPKRLYGHIP